MIRVTIKLTGKRVYINYAGKKRSYKISKGLSRIIKLLQNPNVEMSCISLFHNELAKVSKRKQKQFFSELIKLASHLVKNYPRDEIANSRYVNEVKKELMRLNKQKAIAEAHNDFVRKERLQDEIDKIVDILATVFTTTNGKANVFVPSQAKKVLRAVKISIERAISVIAQDDTEFAEMLKKDIRTGPYCCYRKSRGDKIDIVEKDDKDEEEEDDDDDDYEK